MRCLRLVSFFSFSHRCVVVFSLLAGTLVAQQSPAQDRMMRGGDRMDGMGGVGAAIGIGAGILIDQAGKPRNDNSQDTDKPKQPKATKAPPKTPKKPPNKETGNPPAKPPADPPPKGPTTTAKTPPDKPGSPNGPLVPPTQTVSTPPDKPKDGPKDEPKTPPSDGGGQTEKVTETKDEPLKYVCGPDITEKIYLTLKQIESEYKEASADGKKEACGSLYSPTDYNQAWDITDGLDPNSAPDSKTEDWSKDDKGWKDKKTGRIRLHWLTDRNPACAIPRPDDVCAATVEFNGVCVHAQVANYVMWGLVNRLCANSYNANLKAHDAVKARTGNSDPALLAGQQAMTDVGFYYSPGADLEESKETWKNTLDNASRAGAFKKYDQCSKTCMPKLGKPPFGFTWKGIR